MDISSAAWLSELEMEESDFKINQHQMRNPFIDSVAAFSQESLTDYPSVVTMDQPFQAANSYIEKDLAKQPKYYKVNSNITTDPFASNSVSSSNTFIMSFGNPNSPPEMNPHKLFEGIVKPKEERNPIDFPGFVEGVKRVPGSSRNLTQAQDHVLAERKRRETLTRRFISLSALLPNLKKMDKASVLEDATKYIKQLQTRKKELEETSLESKKFKQESAVSITRSKLSGGADDETSSSSDETNSSPSNNTYNPEIEVRISESSVLVRIYSHRNSTLARKALSEMERLHLTISGSSVIPFSNTALLITITAQMGDECVLTAMDLVKSLQSAIRTFV